MATFNSTTFGSISGKHGTAVAAVTKDGKNILRLYKAPHDPKTKAQVIQRRKFGFVNSTLSPLREVFKTTFRNNSGMNTAVSYAIKNAVSVQDEAISLDYTKLLFAAGSIQLPGKISATRASESNTVNITWDITLSIVDETPDQLNLVAMNAETHFTIVREKLALRDAGQFSFELPDIWGAEQVHLWAYFSTPESNATSASRFVATV